MPAVLRREMRGKLSAVSRRSAGGSGFPDIPAGTSAGVGPVGGGRAADCAGEHFPPRPRHRNEPFFSLFDAEAAIERKRLVFALRLYGSRLRIES